MANWKVLDKQQPEVNLGSLKEFLSSNYTLSHIKEFNDCIVIDNR